MIMMIDRIARARRPPRARRAARYDRVDLNLDRSTYRYRGTYFVFEVLNLELSYMLQSCTHFNFYVLKFRVLVFFKKK
eukprot:SAG31_NODE_3718_length_3951_cov_2.903686_3_plen_78_part_00